MLGAARLIVGASVYATVIITFGVQIARVDGLSMQPTLENGDRLVVDKSVYLVGVPQVGDIVMLIYPLDPDLRFVKRVVAGPGDTIRSVSGVVYRNEVPLPDAFIPEAFRSRDETWGPESIPKGYYFVMGDHRNNSADSRNHWLVPEKYVLGKVRVRWWPLSRIRIFSGF